MVGLNPDVQLNSCFQLIKLLWIALETELLGCDSKAAIAGTIEILRGRLSLKCWV